LSIELSNKSTAGIGERLKLMSEGISADDTLCEQFAHFKTLFIFKGKSRTVARNLAGDLMVVEHWWNWIDENLSELLAWPLAQH